MQAKADRLCENEIDELLSGYERALDLLDDYDHERIVRPRGVICTAAFEYEECREIIERMRFASDSELFGNEKDDSFRGSLGNVFQTFGGVELYPTFEEKAANLLYYLVKNHSFSDGNKRIAAALFICFLAKNERLYRDDGSKRISDEALVALTLMIATSRPDDKEIMISIVMSAIA